MNSSVLLKEKRNLLEKHLMVGMNNYQSLFECNSDAIYAIDLSGYYIFLNPACERLTGYNEKEIANRKFIDIIGLEDVAKVSSYFYRALEGNFQNYDCKIMHKNGQMVDLNVTNLPIAVNDEIIGVYGVAKDITEFKRKRQKLKDSEELYRILTENSMDMIAKTDLDGNILYISPVCKQILGFKPEELIGQSSLDYIHPEDLKNFIFNQYKVSSVLEKSLDTYRVRKKDGSYIVMETMSKSFFKTNKDLRIVSVSRDITERLKMEEERKLTEELLLNSEKLSAAGQLAAGIAHEVRNPLTAIKGFIQLMNVPSDQQSYLDIIHSEINRIEMILSELLILSKPQATKFAMTNVEELVETVRTLLDTQAILKNIQIDTNYIALIPKINCDQNQLKQVVY